MGERILIIEDDADIHEMCRFVLARAGYEVEVATSAAAAREAVERRRPALAIVDVGLPDTLEPAGLVRELRALAGGRLPVLVVTARSPANREVRAIAADAVLTKPFLVEGYLDAVRRALGG